jgi:prepilin-type N-terminal cleavage/methylation domain-containing protein/prepilin-type processing-associated H-X9-DG protein
MLQGPQPCSRPKSGGLDGFSLIELLVVISVIGLLAALLFPALAGVKQRSYATQCQNNLRQVGASLLYYLPDNGNRFVPQSILKPPPDNPFGPTGYGTHTYWPDLMRDYLKTPQVLRCPTFRVPGGLGLGYNTPEFGIYEPVEGSGDRPTLASVIEPAATVVFADVCAISNPKEPDPDRWMPTSDGALRAAGLGNQGVLGPEYNVYFRTPNDSSYESIPHRLINRHASKANVWMLDGAVSARKASSIGFQYYPSSDGNPDPRWLWDR